MVTQPRRWLDRPEVSYQDSALCRRDDGPVLGEAGLAQPEDVPTIGYLVRAPFAGLL